MTASKRVQDYFQSILDEYRASGLCKIERIIHSPQRADVLVEFPGRSPIREVINLCANNYLGLSNHPEIIAAARKALDEKGYGMSSVRFICGTQDIHKELEDGMSRYLGTEDTILYSSCFDANGGVFESLLGEGDVILSDELNHASIIDGIRLCKAHRHRYHHNSIEDLERHLQLSQDKRIRLIVTDGAFSMDGVLAKLDEIVRLGEKYDALVMVDDSHATGFIGKSGRGTPEYFQVGDKIDIITTTFGKALGGASGGCVSGKKFLIDVLRQRSRPYIFSNSLSPVVVAGTLKALEILRGSNTLRDTLMENTKFFRRRLKEIGLEIIDGFHPIIPIMLHDAQLVQKVARDLYDEGVYVVGFFYPVVPKGMARIRVQISAVHNQDHLEKAANAFETVARRHGILR
jgi:glycine C-acetyltransferase